MNGIARSCLAVTLAVMGVWPSTAVATPPLPPIVSAETIARHLLPMSPLASGRKKKITYEAADGNDDVSEAGTEAHSVAGRIALPAIEFEFDSARLTARAEKQVSELARALALPSLRSIVFAVQGHTDSVGDGNYNRALSQRRARTITQYLVARGTDARRLVQIGLGEDYPLPGLPGDHARNRRVEIVRLGEEAQEATSPPSRDGRRRALLIGIDAYRNVSPLVGPVNDAKAMQAFVTKDLGFTTSDVRALLDAEATRANILREIEEWLIDGTRPGDEVFLFFSGHGFQQPDANGDEPDRFDETLVPVDAFVRDDETVSGMIADDEMGALLSRLAGRRVTVVVDACHSGTSDRISVVGEEWRYVKSPRRPDGAPLRLGAVKASATTGAPAAEAFLSTKGPELRGADVTVWAAVEAHQKALIDEEVRGAPLSVFTRRFLSGIRDAEADADANGIVTRSELYGYLLHESEAYCTRHPNRCRRGLTPQLHSSSNRMDVAAFAPRAPLSPVHAKAVKDILLGPAPSAAATSGDGVSLRIEQGTRLVVGTELEVVVRSPRDGRLVLLDVDATGDMVQIFPNEFSQAKGVSARLRAGESKQVPENRPDKPFRLRVSPPAGFGTLVAVVANEDARLDTLTSRHKDLSVVERPKAYLVELAEVLRAGGDNPHRSVATLVYETVMPAQ